MILAWEFFILINKIREEIVLIKNIKINLFRKVKANVAWSSIYRLRINTYA